MITDNTDLRSEIEEIKKAIHNQNQNIEVIFQYLDDLIENETTLHPENG